MKDSTLDDWEALFLHPEAWQVIGMGVSGGACSAERTTLSRRRWSAEHAHCHPGCEMMLCVKGEGLFGLDGMLYPCRPGTLFLMPPETLHDDHYPETAHGMEHLWLRLLSTRVFLAWLSIEHGSLRQRHGHLRVFNLADLALSESYAKDLDKSVPLAYRRARLRLLATAAGLTLCEHLRSGAAGGTEEAAGLPERVIQAICHHLDETAGKNVSLDFLAHLSGYNKYHLHRLFRRHTGMTVHQYIDKARRQRVLGLQEEGWRNGAIAEALGFSCTAAYLRWRRQKMPQ